MTEKSYFSIFLGRVLVKVFAVVVAGLETGFFYVALVVLGLGWP